MIAADHGCGSLHRSPTCNHAGLRVLLAIQPFMAMHRYFPSQRSAGARPTCWAGRLPSATRQCPYALQPGRLRSAAPWRPGRPPSASLPWWDFAARMRAVAEHWGEAGCARQVSQGAGRHLAACSHPSSATLSDFCQGAGTSWPSRWPLLRNTPASQQLLLALLCPPAPGP